MGNSNSKRIPAVVLPVLAMAAAFLLLAVLSAASPEVSLAHPVTSGQSTVAGLASSASVSATKTIVAGLVVPPGGEITYRLWVSRDYPDYGTISISDTLPAYTEFVGGSLSLDTISEVRGNAVYYPVTRTVYYSGSVIAGTFGTPTTLTYTVRVTDTVLDGLPLTSTHLITNLARVYYDLPDGAFVETNVVTTTVRWPRAYLPLVFNNYTSLWTRGTGMPQALVYSIAVCPTDPSTLYAGTGGYGVYRSQNAGRSWTQRGLSGWTVRGVAVDPGSCDTVYAATYGAYVQKSTNGGGSWTRQNSGLGIYSYVYSVIVDPINANVIYAGTSGGGVYGSSDSGVNWTYWSLSGDTVSHLAIVGDANATTIYAATWGSGVHRCARSGETWGSWGQASGFSLSGNVYSVAVDPQNASTVFAAIAPGALYRSTDGGVNSSLVLGTSPAARYVVVDPGNSNVVFAATWGSGVHRSTAGGNSGTWQRFAQGPGNLNARCVSIGPGSALYLHAGTANGAWRRSRW